MSIYGVLSYIGVRCIIRTQIRYFFSVGSINSTKTYDNRKKNTKVNKMKPKLCAIEFCEIINGCHISKSSVSKYKQRLHVVIGCCAPFRSTAFSSHQLKPIVNQHHCRRYIGKLSCCYFCDVAVKSIEYFACPINSIRATSPWYTSKYCFFQFFFFLILLNYCSIKPMKIYLQKISLYLVLY